MLGEAAIKNSMLGDETTFFLKDSNCFLELKKTFFLSTGINKLTRIKQRQQKAYLPDISCKWIDIMII